MAEDERVVELAYLPDAVQASLLAGRLEAEGIQASSGSPLLGGRPGRRVFVFSTDYDRALELATAWGYLGP